MKKIIGLNKDLTMMLTKFAKLKALQVKDIITATDGTRKVNIIILEYLCTWSMYGTVWICVLKVEDLLINDKISGGCRFCLHWMMDW